MLLIGLSPAVLFSANQLDYFKSLNPKLALQLGGFYASQGAAQHININNLIGDQFSVDQQYGSNVLAGVGLYVDGQDTQIARVSYGVDAFCLAQTQVTGDVTQEALFTNLSYRYTLTNYPIYIASKIDVKNNYSEKMNMTFDAGIGPNIINASNFSEQSLDGGVTRPDHIFSSQNTVALSVMVGVGVKFNNVFGKVPLECGYRFFYLGQGQLNKANSEVSTALNTGYNYANALLCTVMI
jgi:hypothetical protein